MILWITQTINQVINFSPSLCINIEYYGIFNYVLCISFKGLYILNTPKNAPIEFINFEQYAVMNSEQYRLNQYYTIFQQNW
jgi:hypothetical protein